MDDIFIRLLGRRVMFLFGDNAVWDRFQWVSYYLPQTADGLRLLDVGCGNGSFTIEAAARGYEAVGLTWDGDATAKANRRARRIGVSARFVEQDARRLEELDEGAFDFAINFENIEHILDDQKLLTDIQSKLKPGGVLLLTTPYYFFPKISRDCGGPHSKIEDGGHVRRGYTEQRLRAMADTAGLEVEAVEFCTGALSRAMISLQRMINGGKIGSVVLWPLKILANALDRTFHLNSRKSAVSICMVMQKPI